MQALIKFIASGSSSATGNFAPGDLLRCSADRARHFVDEARCAVYADAQPAGKSDSSTQTEPKADLPTKQRKPTRGKP